MSLFTVIYVSSATGEMPASALGDLLEQARRFNGSQGITGMLLFRDGNFMQVIEGEEAAVRALYERIRADKRHHGVITLLEEAIEQREFGDWQMGFENLDQIAHEHVFRDIRASLAGDSLEPEGRSRRLMAGFFDRAFR